MSRDLAAHDCAAQALSRLPSYLQRQRWRELVEVIASEIQELDDAILAMATQLHPDAAADAMLDAFGADVREGRGGRSDADYLQAIYLRIAASRSRGLAEDVIRVARTMLGTDSGRTVELQTVGGGAAALAVGGTSGTTLAEATALVEYLRQTVAAGVRLTVTSSSEPDAGTFRFAGASGPPLGILPPDDFAADWRPDFAVLQQADGSYTTDLEESLLLVATTATYYVNVARPNNLGGGLTPANAFKSIWWALAVIGATPTTVYILGSSDPDNPTVYPASDAWLLSVTANANFIVVSDFNTLAPGWAVSSVEATPAVINGFSSVHVDFTVVRLGFRYGNTMAFYLQDVGRAVFIDCEFSHGTAHGLALSSTAAGVAHEVLLVRCRSHDNQSADGFSYTALGAATSIRALELACESYDNAGLVTQGSSGHRVVGNGPVSLVRVASSYHGNAAQELADVGAKSWIVGCTLNGQDNAGVGITIADDGVAWLHGCTFTGNAIDLQTNDAAGVINVYSTTYASTDGPGTVQAYTPEVYAIAGDEGSGFGGGLPYLDLTSLTASGFTTVVGLRSPASGSGLVDHGAGLNGQVTLLFDADSGASATGDLDSAASLPALTFRFKPGVTTIADFEAAITGDAHDALVLITASSVSGLIASPGDEFGASPFTGATGSIGGAFARTQE